MGCRCCKGEQNKKKIEPKEELISLKGWIKFYLIIIVKKTKNIDQNESKMQEKNQFLPNLINPESQVERNDIGKPPENVKENEIKREENNVIIVIKIQHLNPLQNLVEKQNSIEEEELSDEVLIDEKFVREDEKNVVRFVNILI